MNALNSRVTLLGMLIAVSLLQSSKAPLSIVVSDAGSGTWVMAVPLKAFWSISVIPSGRLTAASDLQLVYLLSVDYQYYTL